MLIKYALVGGAAFGAGYFLAKARLEKHYFTLLAHETDEARDHYRRFYEKKAAKDAEETLLAATEAFGKYSGDLSELPKPEDPIMKPYSEVDIKSAAERFKAEESRITGETIKGVPVQYNKISEPVKTEDAPKVTIPAPVEITRDAFVENQLGYKQFSFTYYQGDDVLANESDEAMGQEAREASIGKELLEDLREGGDDTIYIRNRAAKWEFEITRSSGKFADEVLSESG